jgi:hypothetical protein
MRAKKRDDFAEATKRLLAERVAFKCSHPDCGQSTIGPKRGEKKSTKVGLAAHITAASSGGPRFDPNLTSEQRSSYDNGIWLCFNHGTLVDNDHQHFTEKLLRGWKARAENAAVEELDQGTRSGRFGERSQSQIFTRREVNFFQYAFSKLDTVEEIPVTRIVKDGTPRDDWRKGHWEVSISFLKLLLWCYQDQPEHFSFVSVLVGLNFEVETNLGTVETFKIGNWLQHLVPEPLLEQLRFITPRRSSDYTRRYTRRMHDFGVWLDINDVAPKSVVATWIETPGLAIQEVEDAKLLDNLFVVEPIKARIKEEWED